MKKSDLDRKHVLAIDYGTKFTGLATHRVNTDPIILAYGRIKFESDEQLVKEIINLVDEEFIEVIVVGAPYFPDGNESKMTKIVLNFIKLLRESCDLPIFEQDELLSSFEAEERMKNDPKYNFKVDYSKIDSVAATIILEEFLNSRDN